MLRFRVYDLALTAILLTPFCVRAEDSTPTPQSTASPENKHHNRRGRPFILQLGFDYRKNADIDDTRLTGPTPLIPNATGSTMALTQMKFSGSLALFGNRDFALSAGGGVPIKSLGTNDPYKESGSELGGFDSFLELRFLDHFEGRLGFAERQSPKLYLYDSHPEYLASLSYDMRQTLFGNVGFVIKAGPEFVYAVGSDVKGIPIHYGPQYGAQGNIYLDLFLSREAHFRLGTEILYRRIGSYAVNSVDQGAATLSTLTPSFDYHLLEELWVGLYAEIPTQRPEGREASFGNSELAGLYGRSFGLRLRAATL